MLVFVGLLGAYYAMTDGVLMALASTVVPTNMRATGLGLVATASSLGRLLASVLFGTIWTFWGIDAAVGVFLGLLLVMTAGTGAFRVRWWDNRGHAA